MALQPPICCPCTSNRPSACSPARPQRQAFTTPEELPQSTCRWQDTADGLNSADGQPIKGNSFILRKIFVYHLKIFKKTKKTKTKNPNIPEIQMHLIVSGLLQPRSQ